MPADRADSHCREAFPEISSEQALQPSRRGRRLRLTASHAKSPDQAGSERRRQEPCAIRVRACSARRYRTSLHIGQRQREEAPTLPESKLRLPPLVAGKWNGSLVPEE